MRWALALIIFLSACAAPENKKCFEDRYVHGTFVNITRDDLPDMSYRILSDRERDAFLKRYNRQPPPTGMMYDQIGVFFLENYLRVMVIFIEDGCVWATVVMNRALFDEMIMGPSADEV